MIRLFKREDRDQLIELFRMNAPQYFHESEEKDYVQYLDNEVEDYFVVEEQGRAVGAGGINYFPLENEARISWDMIHPALHGKGIGKELVRHRIEHIKQNSTAKIIIVRTSQHASGFYAKLGFQLVRTEKDFWAEGFDLYEMKMVL